MFCPECRSEFRPEILRCPDCDTALVAALPVDRHDDPGESAVVLRTGDATFLPIAVALLESAEIPFWVEGEESWGMLPLWLGKGPISSSGIEVVVRVPAARAAEATALLEQPGDRPEGALPAELAGEEDRE